MSPNNSYPTSVTNIDEAQNYVGKLRRPILKTEHFHASFQSDFNQKCISYSADLDPPIRAYTHSIMHHQFTIDWSYDDFDVLNDKDCFHR